MRHIKTTLIAASIAFWAAATPAHANLGGALDGMLSNTTNPTAYQSQSRMGFIGGSVQLRSPIKNVNLVAFDPPRFNAGCGGVDLFGGSFSFINADALVALFRQIAQNALGAIFMRALNAIDPKLGAIIQQFQSKVQALNQLNKNTCAIAKQAVNTIWDSTDVATGVAELGAELRGSIKGDWDDLFASAQAVVANPGDAIRETCDEGGLDFCGNVVWDLISDNRAGRVLGGGSIAGLSEKYAAELIMSMIGTAIYDPSTGTSDKPPVMVLRPGIIDINDLRIGNSEGAEKVKYVCPSAPSRGGCRSMDEAPWGWEGVIGYTNRMLFGTPDRSAVTADSIVGKMSDLCTGSCAFTTSQQSFINSIQPPVMALMLDVQGQTGAPAAVASYMAPIIADDLLFVLAEAVLRASRQVIATSGNTQIPPEVHARVQQLGSEYAVLVANRQMNIDKVMHVADYVREIARRNPAMLEFSAPR